MRPHILHNGLHRIGNQLNHLIDGERFLGRDPFEDNWLTRSKRPRTNVVANRKNYDLEVALPGFKKEEITLSVESWNLIINAHRAEPTPKEAIIRQEFSGASLKRIFHLPQCVDTDAIQASLERGILHIRLPYQSKPTPPVKEVSIQ